MSDLPRIIERSLIKIRLSSQVKESLSMLVANEEGLSIAREYKTELLKKMFPKSAVQEITAQARGKEDSIRLIDFPPSNIIGIGYGSKEANGKSQGEIAVRVYVREKLSNSQLSLKEKIPFEINGTPTDVIPVGDICALACATPRPRITAGGTSIRHYEGPEGTLGCLVVLSSNEEPNQYYILSNNHVLANCNDSSHGDSIEDGGRNAIAVLADYEMLQLQENKSEIHQYTYLDAAIARVLNSNEVIPEIITIGRVQRLVTEAALYQPVCKYGITTQYTNGSVEDISAEMWVSYNTKNGTRYAYFIDQLGITTKSHQPFSMLGDSGSLVVHETTKQPVALLFAGGGIHFETGHPISFATPLARITMRFNICFS